MSGSEVLPTIPRTTLLNSFADFQIETTAGTINGNLTIYSSSFSHYVQLFKNGVERANWSIGSGPVGSYNYSLALSSAQRDAIFGDMPSSVSDVFTIVVSTYNGGPQIGSSQSRTATGTIPAGYKPSITTANSNFSWTNKNSALTGYMIQNISTLTLLLSGGSAPTGASLAGYQVRFGTVTRSGGYSGAAISENVGLVPNNGTLYAYYAVYDSRGRWSDEISESMSVQGYNPPISNGFSVRRNGSVATSADFVLKFGNSLYALGNTWTYMPYYWTGSYWQACKASTAIAAASIDSVYTHALPYSESLVYNLKVVLTDLFNSAEYTDTLPTSAFPLSIGKKGCGFGKDTSDTYNIEAGALGISSDGPIYQGGAPIVESGSNANGKYVKFSDGTMICRHYLTMMAVANSLNDLCWTMPVDMYGADYVLIPTLAAIGTTYSFIINMIMGTNTSVSDATVTFYPTVAQIYGFALLAIGRWKA